MMLYTLAYSLVLAFLLALLFSGLTKGAGPKSHFWALFVIFGLSIWVASIWLTPAGPIWYGVAWVDLLVIGLLLVLLVGAASGAGRYPTVSRSSYSEEEEVDLVAESKKDTTAITMFGVFFWIFVASLVALAIIGLT
jgi:hypothetical protein